MNPEIWHDDHTDRCLAGYTRQDLIEAARMDGIRLCENCRFQAECPSVLSEDREAEMLNRAYERAGLIPLTSMEDI